MKLSTRNFKRNLREHRTTLGLTQARLGEMCGLTNMWISHFENGNRLPSLKNFTRLCNALNIPPQNLLIP